MQLSDSCLLKLRVANRWVAKNPSVYRDVLKIIEMDIISEEKVHAELCGYRIIARLVEGDKKQNGH